MNYLFCRAGSRPDTVPLKQAECRDDAEALFMAIRSSTVSGATDAWQGNALVCRVPASVRPNRRPSHANTDPVVDVLRSPNGAATLDVLAHVVPAWIERQRRRTELSER